MPRLLLAGNVVAAVALGLPLLAAYVGNRTLPPELFTGTEVLASCLFACTGLLCLVGWRLLGYARSAYVGGCFALFGILTAPLPLVGVLLPDGHEPGLTAPLASAAIALGALTLAARTAYSPQVLSRLRPARLLAEAAGLSAGLYILLVVILAAVGNGGRATLYLTAEATVLLAWLAVGGWFALQAGHGRIGSWPGCAMLVIAAQEALRLASVIEPKTWMFPAGTLMLVGAGSALAGSGKGLVDVLSHQDRSLLRLSVDLQASEDRIAGERDRRQEQLHDVRSALAAIRCANGTLHRYAAGLDERTRATLEDALTKELGRLEGLVDPSISHPLIDFRLRDLLSPLVATESSLGSEILLHVGDLAVHGRPVDTAAVVQNLLVNARRYAPRSVVTIHASQRDGRVSLQVEDSGPGVPERERAAVFERGVRGSTSIDVEGTGLGLFVSRRLMAEQHGSLKLRPGAVGGACFVLDLPTARALPVVLTQLKPQPVHDRSRAPMQRQGGQQ
ncbi:MAG TPA: sensor histidine kinase [Frankiaceae bacterium]|nr:sensor histidine kinase [Frankiaceae bacterium]